MEPRTDKPARAARAAAPRPRAAGAAHSISIALAGSGGSGVMTAGTLLVSAAAKAGWYGLMVRTSGPQIRGGELAALVRLGRQPIDTLDDAFDVLLAIDWQNVNRFVDEIPLSAGSVVIGDSDEGDPPDVFHEERRAPSRAAAQEDGEGDQGQLDQHGRARRRGRTGGHSGRCAGVRAA